MRKTFLLLDALVASVCRWGVVGGLVILLLLLSVSIIARATGLPLAGYDEIVELSIIWMIMLGALALWREGQLYRVEVLSSASRRAAPVFDVIIHGLMFGFAVILILEGGEFALNTRESTPFLNLNKMYYYLAIPVTATLMSIYSAIRTLNAVLLVGRAVFSKPRNEASESGSRK